MLGELHPSWEQISAVNSKKAMRVTPTASRPLMGGTAPINREGRPLLSLEIQESSRGREGPRRPPATSTVYYLCHGEGKVRATSSQSCHKLPASGGLDSRGTIAWRPPSYQLGQETMISCQNQLKMSPSFLTSQHLCFISQSLHCRHRTLHTTGSGMLRNCDRFLLCSESINLNISPFFSASFLQPSLYVDFG